LNFIGQQCSVIHFPSFCPRRFGQLEQHRRECDTRTVAAGFLLLVLDRGDYALDGIGSPQMDSMLGREVVEGEEYVAVLGQAF
jgi:hypothetical protein